MRTISNILIFKVMAATIERSISSETSKGIMIVHILFKSSEKYFENLLQKRIENIFLYLHNSIW